MAPPSLRATMHVPNEIVEDIFVCVPPDNSALLLRSALTCKRWARLFADRGFRRRYSQSHGKAPILGIIANLTITGGVARFIPTHGFCPARDERHGYRAHDARHGRVLLNRLTEASDAPQGQGQEPSALAVWNPITGEQHQLPLLKRRRQVHSWNAAVLCGAAAGACDHVDCHRGPFRVVFVGIDAKQIFSHVYCSDSGALSEKATTAPLQDDQLECSTPPCPAC
ncbi:uncharacterized protein LOC101776556 [Setaria italica]|uniref:uncharacterized protein LOC101776556 n=1 Tax=Setaria italica TaxID=4555 RepID=UPI000647DA2F|nr:uncharacterized protein LOC101776556 [Setaria italica]